MKNGCFPGLFLMCFVGKQMTGQIGEAAAATANRKATTTLKVHENKRLSNEGKDGQVETQQETVVIKEEDKVQEEHMTEHEGEIQLIEEVTLGNLQRHVQPREDGESQVVVIGGSSWEPRRVDPSRSSQIKVLKKKTPAASTSTTTITTTTNTTTNTTLVQRRGTWMEVLRDYTPLVLLVLFLLGVYLVRQPLESWIAYHTIPT